MAGSKLVFFSALPEREKQAFEKKLKDKKIIFNRNSFDAMLSYRENEIAGYVMFEKEPHYNFLTAHEIYVFEKFRIPKFVKNPVSLELARAFSKHAESRGLKLKLILNERGEKFDRKAFNHIKKDFPHARYCIHREDVPEMRVSFKPKKTRRR